MRIDNSIGGRKTLKIAHLSEEGIKTLEDKYGEFGFKFNNKGDDFVIKFNRVKPEDMHLLEKVTSDAILMICKKL